MKTNVNVDDIVARVRQIMTPPFSAPQPPQRSPEEMAIDALVEKVLARMGDRKTSTYIPASPEDQAPDLTLYYEEGADGKKVTQVQWPTHYPDGVTHYPTVDTVFGQMTIRKNKEGRWMHNSQFLTNGKMKKKRKTGEILVKPKVYVPYTDATGTEQKGVMWYIDLSAGTSPGGTPINPNDWRAYTLVDAEGPRTKEPVFFAWRDRNVLYQMLGKPIDPAAVPLPSKSTAPAVTQPDAAAIAAGQKGRRRSRAERVAQEAATQAAKPQTFRVPKATV